MQAHAVLITIFGESFPIQIATRITEVIAMLTKVTQVTPVAEVANLKAFLARSRIKYANTILLNNGISRNWFISLYFYRSPFMLKPSSRFHKARLSATVPKKGRIKARPTLGSELIQKLSTSCHPVTNKAPAPATKDKMRNHIGTRSRYREDIQTAMIEKAITWGTSKDCWPLYINSAMPNTGTSKSQNMIWTMGRFPLSAIRAV